MAIELPPSLSWANNIFGMQNLISADYFPSTAHSDSQLTSFNFRYLLQQALSVFEWDLPESLERNYFLYSLYLIGYGFVFYTDEFGIVYNTGGFSGFDVYYNPVYGIVDNPTLPKMKYEKMKIGEECAIIRLTPDMMGIADLVKYYAELLSEAETSLQTNLINTKFSYIFAVKDSSTEKSLKLLYDKIAGGETAVFADKKLFDANGNLQVELFNQDVKSVYIGDTLLVNIREILNDYYSKIGIPNANITKKERMIKDEANANNFETRALCYGWYDCLKKDLEKSNKMFPDFKIDVKFREGSEMNAVADESNTNRII